MRIGRPARHEMRKDRGTSSKPALQGVLQVQQAQIIFASLAHHDLGLERFMVGVNALRFSYQLPLKRFGKGGNPNRAVSGGGPKACRGQIAKRLADACAGFCQQHMRFALAGARRENFGSSLGKIALALPRFSRPANERRQPLLHGVRLKRHDAWRGAGRGFFPFGQAAEQPSLGPFGLFDLRQDQIGPWPAQPH